MRYKNWKLTEIVDSIIQVEYEGASFKDKLFAELNIKERKIFNDLDRRETEIDWRLIEGYYSLKFDDSNLDSKLELMLRNTEMVCTQSVLLFYNQENIAIEIETQKFITEWEDFFQSTKFNTIIINTEHRLIMEVSRDYVLHSNFEIWNEEIYNSK